MAEVVALMAAGGRAEVEREWWGGGSAERVGGVEGEAVRVVMVGGSY